ncbi:hypothetical protein QAD02_009470 [Eretmocerus hayati]|uniref:Uncharacterized protein n=1 Tax=Eretmocerus hayati TaxID=131215 RepID=A0ACC2N9P0_9HYME|nr:hypothetical protein QAD02_009470 [Eretmocerus hayati]
MELVEFCNRDEEKFINCLENILADQISEYSHSEEQLDSIEKCTLTAINTRLDKATTRSQGLKLLCSFSEKISKDSLTKYLPHWINKLSQALSNAPNGSLDFTLACKAVSAVVVSCKKVPELDKRISMNHVKPFIGIIVDRYNKETDLALLNLLTVLLYHYPESCVRFQASYSSIILSCIDIGDQDFVTAGAKCYSLLVRALEKSFVHSSKENSSIISDNSSASCHISHQIDLCNNLSKILDELFQEYITEVCETFYELKSTTNIHSLKLEKISCEDLLEYYTDMSDRFVNICTYLALLLKIGGSGSKKFTQPNVLLQVICRGLSITPANLHKSSGGNKNNLLFILPKLYSGLLQVLQSLIASFQQELIPFAVTIQRLILQCLECTQKSCSQSWINIRLCAYQTLCLWLDRTGSCSGFQMIADDFLTHILKDLTPSNKNVLLLKASKSSSKSKSKSNKSKEKVKATNDTGNTSTLSESANIILSAQALATVKSVISSMSVNLSLSSYEKIQTSVVLLLYEQYVTNTHSSVSEIGTNFRLQLIKAFRTLQAYTRSSSLSTLSYAIQIFGIATSQDSDPRIVEEATLGLAEIRPLIYPTAPTLMFSLSKPAAPKPTYITEQEQEPIKIIDCSTGDEILEKGSDVTTRSSKRPRIESTPTEKTTIEVEKKNCSSAPTIESNLSVEVVKESTPVVAVMESSPVVTVKDSNPSTTVVESSASVVVMESDTTVDVKGSSNSNGNFNEIEDEDMLTSFCDEVC